MKLASYILITTMVLLGLNSIMEDINLHPATEVTCSCCGTNDDSPECPASDYSCEKGEAGHEDDSNRCPAGCDCSCCFHLVAIEYHFLPGFVVAPLTMYYGDYSNTYHFEFQAPLFQPPRFS